MPERIAQYCKVHLNLQNAELSEEYYYRSLPFCIIDAVFSLAARYSSTKNAVIRFCNVAGLQRLRQHGSPYPDTGEQYSVSQLVEFLSGYDDYRQIATEVFDNRQRTSTKKDAIEEGLKLLVQVKRQKEIKRFRGKLKWSGNLDEVRLDK